MSGKQKAVIWIGLILIVLNIVSQWRQVKDVLFGSGSQPNSGGGGTVGPNPLGPNPLQWVFPWVLPLSTQKPPVQKTPVIASV